MSALQNAMAMTRRVQPVEMSGRIERIRGLTAHVRGLNAAIGSLVRIDPSDGAAPSAFGEVVGCDRGVVICMLFSAMQGLGPGDRVIGLQASPTVSLGSSMLGRVLNGLGQPIDGLGPLHDTVPCPLAPEPISALLRAPIEEPIPTGVRVLDSMVTAGKGQRLGVFAGPGVGKSTLIGSIARNTEADTSVIALIGERGREVREFIDKSLGPDGLARSVVVVATSDESPLLRTRAAMVASAAAEFLRDQGRDVMLMMDSITRFCQAQRQIGLAAGEPPATKGYTPSVFASLASLLERAGAVQGRGSITGIYAVLVEGDDLTEPVSDAARGILDGHISLSRKLANRGHFPAVDVLDSVSRVATDVTTKQHQQARTSLLRLLADFSEVEELVNIGAYARGSNPAFDVAIEMKPRLDEFFQQGASENADYAKSAGLLLQLAVEAGASLANRQKAARR
ncbi:MAG: FliI/YscN family ATPase [Phycisphaerales bacterium]